MVKTLLPMQEVWFNPWSGSLCPKTKTRNRSKIVTNSIESFKVVHIKKKIFKQEKKTVFVHVSSVSPEGVIWALE